MKDQRLVAVNEQGMLQLHLEVYDYWQKIQTLFYQMEEIVEGTKSIFVGDSGEYYRSHFGDDFKEQQHILHNIQSIAEDISYIRNKFYQYDNDSKMQIHEAIDTLDIKEVYDFHSNIRSSNSEEGKKL